MPARETTIIGAPCWVDLSTSDVERSRSFYTGVFGWTADEPAEEFGGYFNFRKDGALVAGGMASQPGQAVPDVWSVYLATDDAAKTVEAAEAGGGTVVVPPMPVGDLGTMAHVTDPGGALVGIWQPGTFPGFEVVAEGGAPSWFELYTRDYDAALPFYREVFRVESRPMPEAEGVRYTTLVEGGNMLAGIYDAAGDLPEGAPAHWTVYFGVDDTDAALDRIVELGGTVVTPAEDTPYGRLATAADPQGARFKLVAPNESMPAK